MPDIVLKLLLALFLAVVVLSTARLARTKGRNPWLWGGASFLLLQIQDLLGLAPLAVLFFVKSQRAKSPSSNETGSCPRCESPQAEGRRFCTSCGWELAAPYNRDATAQPEQQSRADVHESPESQDRSAPSVSSPEPEASSTPGSEPPQVEAVDDAGPQPEEREEPKAKEPAYTGSPTAASMTERGVRLYNLGRTQEAIDQFTKAIALDPNYTQAWARRAEAYARLGRGEEAEEDRRRIEALEARSAGG